jgi:hypothetical protein
MTFVPPQRVHLNERLTLEKGVSGPHRMIGGTTPIGAL